MSATNVKIKELRKIVGDHGINDMFEEMMGIKDADPEIIIPKFVKARNLIIHIYKVLDQFCNFKTLQDDFPKLKPAIDDIKKFIIQMQENICFSPNIEETENKYHSLDKVQINQLYKKFKDNQYVKRLIINCGRLKQWHSCFDDPNNLKDNFIGQEPGLSLFIFDFSSLNLKELWADDKQLKPVVKKYILNVIHIIWKDLFALYKIITSPDVDIEKFTQILLESIMQLQKQPGLDRCKNAFQRIKNSVELLNSNFDNYYRESVASSNPNMIIENFIIDVSNQGGANAQLTREFRVIIQYMHKMSAQNGKNQDPNVKKLFKMLNKNFEIMEQHTTKKIEKQQEPLTNNRLKTSSNSLSDATNLLDSIDDSSILENSHVSSNNEYVPIYHPAKDSTIVRNKKYKRKIKYKKA